MPILFRYFLVLLLAMSSGNLLAQDTPDAAPAASSSTPAPTPAQALTQLRSQLDSIKATADTRKDNTPLSEVRAGALAVQQQAEQLGATLSPQSASLQARLDVLGAPPAKGAPAEPAELAAQRRQLTKSKNDLDNQLKQAQSLSAEATQLAAHVAQLRADQFQAQLASRTTTPFSRAFWTASTNAFPDDMTRLRRLGSDVAAVVAQAWQPPNRTPFVLCLVVAVLLFSVGRWLIERVLFNVTTHRMPSGRLRRSALAVAVTLTYTLAIGLAAHFIYLALNWNDLLDDDLDDLARKLVGLLTFAAFMTGLGRAMLSNHHPSWRLPALSDDAAQRLRAFPWLLGGATVLLRGTELINNAIGASLASTVTTRALLSVLLALLVGRALAHLGQSRRAMLAAGEQPQRRPLWVGLAVGAAFVGVGLTLLGVATGYIAFAFFIARQMLWVGLVLTTLYLLTNLVNDTCNTVFAPDERTGKRMQSSFGLSTGALEQAGTVLSGVTRAALLILAVAFVLAPFGAGPQELASRAGGLLAGAKLGSLSISPNAIFGAMLLFVLGMVVVRVIKDWLGEQLLPKTSLDPGMRSSMVTLLGYVGGVLVFGLALGVMGVDLQSIAWMASALSVGIGFGLQAIVQNFISGLILLAERPVKVGDWVSIGGVDGDIRRINVRATEIQMSDRSTMIVPNSQFITSNIRNITLANAQGRVQIKLPMPLDTDASKVRELILEVLRAHPGTLSTPAPSVTLDNLDGGSMLFSCTAYVNSPRVVSGVKSDLLFEILERLRQAKLPMTSPQSMVVRNLPPLSTDHDEQD